ncbi:MAG TPA: hypothetical protein VMX58_01165, partial [Patescibacteria group bacterium]|nr:hypothetical protein [Patescibacteria group bacterium]
MAQRETNSGMAGAKAPSVKLKPISKGAIFVFNSIQQGMYGNMMDQTRKVRQKFFSDTASKTFEYLVAFGPFDNILRIEHDNFCVVNEFSSLQGVSSQQIQIAYPIHRMGARIGAEASIAHFGIITQLKIQNYLMLGNGPEIEEAVASLLVDRLKKYREMEVELFATLGWDEFIIVLKNYRGFNSLFVPIVETVRGLTLADLQEYVDIKVKPERKSNNKLDLSQKHIFLSSYSTPYYSKSISDHLENFFERHIKERRKADLSISEEDIEKALRGLSGKREFGGDIVSVSTRLSIKPGHLGAVNSIINRIFGTGPQAS